MLKKRFQTNDPVFDMKNFRHEWFKACAKIGVGEKTGPEWYKVSNNARTTENAVPVSS
jgi:hypothetical protein